MATSSTRGGKAKLAAAPEPVTDEGGQLVFAGMPIGDQSAKLAGAVTLPSETLDALTLGQEVSFRVTARVESVGGKVVRDEWGEDSSTVAWKLGIVEAVVV